MVMPSSGPISMAQAHAEFGLGYNLNAYYGCDSGVPISGAISLANLYGKQKRVAYPAYRLKFQSATESYIRIAEIELREVAGGASLISSSWGAQAGYTEVVEGGPYDTLDKNVNTFIILNYRATSVRDFWTALNLNQAKVVRQVAFLPPPNFRNEIQGFSLYGATSQYNAQNSIGLTLIKTVSGLPLNQGWLLVDI
ncbi:hypothetical protein GCM10027276_03870 [Comamonas piscis]